MNNKNLFINDFKEKYVQYKTNFLENYFIVSLCILFPLVIPVLYSVVSEHYFHLAKWLNILTGSVFSVLFIIGSVKYLFKLEKSQLENTLKDAQFLKWFEENINLENNKVTYVNGFEFSQSYKHFEIIDYKDGTILLKN